MLRARERYLRREPSVLRSMWFGILVFCPATFLSCLVGEAWPVPDVVSRLELGRTLGLAAVTALPVAVAGLLGHWVASWIPSARWRWTLFGLLVVIYSVGIVTTLVGERIRRAGEDPPLGGAFRGTYSLTSDHPIHPSVSAFIAARQLARGIESDSLESPTERYDRARLRQQDPRRESELVSNAELVLRAGSFYSLPIPGRGGTQRWFPCALRIWFGTTSKEWSGFWVELPWERPSNGSDGATNLIFHFFSRSTQAPLEGISFIGAAHTDDGEKYITLFPAGPGPLSEPLVLKKN